MSLLRQRLASDASARKELAEEHANAPNKLKKKRHENTAGGESEVDGESIRSRKDSTRDLGEVEEEDTRSLTLENHGFDKNTVYESEESLNPKTTQQKKSSGSYLMVLPNLGISVVRGSFSIASSTNRTVLSVPRSIASSLPIVGGYIAPPSNKPKKESSVKEETSHPVEEDTSAPKEHSSTPSNVQETQERAEQSKSLAWRTAEAGVGFGIAAALLPLAATGIAYGRYSEWRGGKGKKSTQKK